MIIAFEGIDGSGKQTQIELLCAALEKAGKTCKVFKFPTSNARKASSHLLGSAKISQAELFEDFSKDIESSTPLLQDATKKFNYVILDRYIYSTIAYQGGEIGFENALEKAKGLKLVKPDVVVFLKLDPNEASLRKSAQKQPDVFERDLEFQKSVALRYGLLAISGFFSGQWMLVDASKSPVAIHGIIIKAVMK